jgi:hypothetical protein
MSSAYMLSDSQPVFICLKISDTGALYDSIPMSILLDYSTSKAGVLDCYISDAYPA